MRLAHSIGDSIFPLTLRINVINCSRAAEEFTGKKGPRAFFVRKSKQLRRMGSEPPWFIDEINLKNKIPKMQVL
jgi:hypothetical protein